jgi:integrase
MSVHAKTKPDGTLRGYEVRAYDPRAKKNVYVGFRKKLKGPGGANELEREKEAEFAGLAAHGRTDDDGPTATTCRELADRWIADRTAPNADKRWKDNTHKQNRETIQAFLKEFGDAEPNTIRRERALKWARGVPVNCVDVARTMLNHSIDLGLCTTNCLVRPVISKDRGRKDDPPLTEDDLQTLYDACRVLGKYSEPMRGWIGFQAYVGCRPAEGLAIERDKHVNLKEDLVEILLQKYRDGSLGLPKNNRTRTVILPTPAREALDRIPRRTDSPWLFHAKTGVPLLYATMLATGTASSRRRGSMRTPAIRRASTRTTCATSAAHTWPTSASSPRTLRSSWATPTAAFWRRSSTATATRTGPARACTRPTVRTSHGCAPSTRCARPREVTDSDGWTGGWTGWARCPMDTGCFAVLEPVSPIKPSAFAGLLCP